MRELARRGSLGQGIASGGTPGERGDEESGRTCDVELEQENALAIVDKVKPNGSSSSGEKKSEKELQ